MQKELTQRLGREREGRREKRGEALEGVGTAGLAGAG